jgi:CBS-domain-containing membrane protein
MEIENIDELAKKLNQTKLVDVMSKFVITISPETSIIELYKLLKRFKISGVPVIGKRKNILGIVTANDLFEIIKNIMKSIENKHDRYSDQPLRVCDIMSRKVFCASEETSFYDALKLMCKEDIQTLPVLSGEEMFGVIGRRDVMKVFFQGALGGSGDG